MSAEQVGDLAFGEGIRLHELTTVRASLEEAFIELTADSVEYHADAPGRPGQHDDWKRGLTDDNDNDNGGR